MVKKQDKVEEVVVEEVVPVQANSNVELHPERWGSGTNTNESPALPSLDD